MRASSAMFLIFPPVFVSLLIARLFDPAILDLVQVMRR